MKYGIPIKLPDGNSIGFELHEFRDFLMDFEHFSPFIGGPEEYFAKTLGEDWLAILKFENQALAYIKEHAIGGVGASHEIQFAGKEGNVYLFKVKTFYNCPSDPGYVNKVVRVTPTQTTSIEDELISDNPRETRQPQTTSGKLYSRAKRILSESFQ